MRLPARWLPGQSKHFRGKREKVFSIERQGNDDEDGRYEKKEYACADDIAKKHMPHSLRQAGIGWKCTHDDLPLSRLSQLDIVDTNQTIVSPVQGQNNHQQNRTERCCQAPIQRR